MKLIKWDQIRTQIEEAKDIEEINKMADNLEAMRVWAKQSKQSLETINRISEYRLRLERKKGGWLSENISQGSGMKKKSTDGTSFQLEDLEITKNESSKSQLINTLTDEEFEEYIEEQKDKGEEVTLSGAIKLAKEKKFEKDKEQEIEERKEKVKDIKISELIEGDCIENIEKLEENSVHCLIIDPPYGIDFQSHHKQLKHNKIKNDKEEAFNLLAKSLELVKNKLIDGSHIYIFTSWKVYPQFKLIIEKYFEIKNLLVWIKNNWSMGDLQSNYAEQYEMVIFASKGKQKKLIGNRPTNVLKYDRIVSEVHPTEKPVELIKEFVLNSTTESEVVLDCFAGSGSTGLACQETGRNFILMESEPKYIDIIKERLTKKTE